MMTLKNGGRQGRGCGTKVAFVSTVHYGPHACVFVSSAGRIMGCLMKLLVGIITFLHFSPHSLESAKHRYTTGVSCGVDPEAMRMRQSIGAGA